MTFAAILDLIKGDTQAERAVPRRGFTARLTVFTAAAMAFLAVFALALSFAAGRLADQWASELAQTSTLRIPATVDDPLVPLETALRVLQETPGVASARALDPDEQQALLEPWFGPDLPLATLPIPQLIEVIEAEDGYDAAGLRARLAGEVPGAVLDDHTRWRDPLIAAASRVRLLGWVSIGLIAATIVAIVTLAAQAALAANAQVISVLRLVGATDTYIARAFVRRFTLRGIAGAALGTIAGFAATFLLPTTDVAGGFLGGLRFPGVTALWLVLIPVLSGVAAFVATRWAALGTLKENS